MICIDDQDFATIRWMICIDDRDSDNFVDDLYRWSRLRNNSENDLYRWSRLRDNSDNDLYSFIFVIHGEIFLKIFGEFIRETFSVWRDFPTTFHAIFHNFYFGEIKKNLMENLFV